MGEAPHEKALGDSFGLSPPHGDFWGERSFAAMAAWLGDIGTAASRSEACRRGGGFRFGFCICLCFDAAAAFGPTFAPPASSPVSRPFDFRSSGCGSGGGARRLSFCAIRPALVPAMPPLFVAW